MEMNFKSKFMNILQERGFLNQCSDFEEMDRVLLDAEKTGNPCVGYLGSDPTGDSLHVGHLVPVMIMRWFQKCGNKPLMLVGGATGRIGDPSGKDTQRPFLSDEIIKNNSDGLKKSYSKFISFGENKTDSVLVDNYDWFKGIGYLEFLREVGANYSINKMLSKDSVKSRLDREQSMSFLEFNYQLLQGYDFVELNRRYGCTMQLCGSDQWGNAITGVELGHKLVQKDFHVLSAPILTDASGKKMGKSEGNAVWLNEDKLSSYDYYQYWRNVEDTEVIKLLKIFTELPMDKIREYESYEGAELNEVKKILAFECTKLCRGEAEAISAQQTAIEAFEKGHFGGDLPTFEKDFSTGPFNAVDLFIECNLGASKKEVRRLIDQGGAKINDEKISDANLEIDTSYLNDGQVVLAAGKKKKAIIKNI